MYAGVEFESFHQAGVQVMRNWGDRLVFYCCAPEFPIENARREFSRKAGVIILVEQGKIPAAVAIRSTAE